MRRFYFLGVVDMNASPVVGLGLDITEEFEIRSEDDSTCAKESARFGSAASIGTVIIIGKLYKNLKIILGFIAGCDK